MTEDWRAALFRRRYLGVRLDLEPMRAILAAWIPEFDARVAEIEVVQIVGTNGKGSTAAMLEHLLRTRAPAREPVGLYTSPHLHRIGERIRVDGVAIADEAIQARVEELAALEATIGVEASFFEVLTAIALRHFIDQGCRTLVLEAGLGARLDATSAIPATRVGLTRVALDHREYLGDTLAAIAAEKAAAIRSSSPAFTIANQAPEVRMCFSARAEAFGAPLRFVEPSVRAPACMPGRHQRDNAGLALALAHSLGVSADIDGLDDARWPGRLERLAIGSGELWLDVAHNPDGVRALGAALDELGIALDTVVVGARADKDVDAMLGILEGRGALWWAPPAGGEVVPGPTTDRCFTGPDSAELHRALRRGLDGGQRILVCGSHQVVGPIRAQLLGEHGDDPRLSDPVVRESAPTGQTRR